MYLLSFALKCTDVRQQQALFELDQPGCRLFVRGQGTSTTPPSATQVDSVLRYARSIAAQVRP
eukprot:SAG25_NODE_4771_length_751_cov_1.250000_1_plen_62_part_01